MMNFKLGDAVWVRWYYSPHLKNGIISNIKGICNCGIYYKCIGITNIVHKDNIKIRKEKNPWITKENNFPFDECPNCNLNKNSVDHIYTLDHIYLKNEIFIKLSNNIKNILLKYQNLNNNK